MKWTASLVAAAVVVGLAGPSQAGQVKLEIRAGLVTLDARDATVPQILAEWARVGRTTVVNAEKAPAGPVTLVMTGVPERQALETLLRTSAGFVAAPREADQPSASAYDRIVVMPGLRPAVVPVNTARPATSPMPFMRDHRVMPPITVGEDEDQPEQQPQASPASAMPAGQRPGLPFANPYAPAAGAQPSGAPPIQTETQPQYSVRPGVAPPTPAPPIKGQQDGGVQ